MIATLTWYVIVSAVGWLAWPLLYRLLPRLPDRGYTLSRALGLLLIGYVYWLPGVLGLLHNSVGGILFAILLVAGAAVWASTRGPERLDLLGWLKANRAPVLTAEVLFAAAFFGWALFRSFNPDILGTEKPMELAFLNGFRLSPTLPPRDPWLAGYAISYYYFGYVLIGMVADLAGTASAVAFNLGNALLFALTLLGSFGLVYNLLASRSPGQTTRNARGALLAPLFVGVMGNLAGLLELLRAVGAFGADFWRWLDIIDLNTPAGTTLWPPATWRNWWWWRGSRVIHDRDLLGNSIGLQPIDEFPFFSFLLGDMHPHVLALPFVLSALALAFHTATPRGPDEAGPRQDMRPMRTALVVLVFGGLAFLNTWDLPIYLFVLVGALVVRRIRERGWFDPFDVLTPAGKGIAIGALGLIAYLPWLISFGSQAGGVLPNAIFATRFHQFFVMFGPLLVVCTWFVAHEGLRLTRAHRADWRTGLMLALALLAALIVLAAGLSAAALRTGPEAAAFVLNSTGAPDVRTAAGAILRHRLTYPLTPLALSILIAATLAATLTQPDQSTNGGERAGHPPSPYPASTGFALVLILTGALLTLGPEFLYLRDNFGQRLNTIFKFYYAAWILWAVAAAYGAAVLLGSLRTAGRAIFAAVLAVLVLGGLVYPALAVPSKANGFALGDDQTPTLDGIAYMETYYPGDYRGIRWLQENAPPDAVVLEAVGGAYSHYGRVSSATGLPTLLGWPNHERQWRGARYADYASTREQDVQEIYSTRSVERARDLLTRYGVMYVFVGSLERNPEYASTAGLAKFEEFLTPAYADEGVTIYRTDITTAEAQP